MHNRIVSRGQTRRVARLIANGDLSQQLVDAADHEADRLAHPYIGVQHIELARLALAGRVQERDALRATLQVGVRRRWWRPLGPGSALRRAGLAETRCAQRAAEDQER